MADKPLNLKIVKGHLKKVTCPLCQQLAEAPYEPFCSQRCAQLDLGKWLTGDYAIPDHDAIDDSDFETLLTSHGLKKVTQADDGI